MVEMTHDPDELVYVQFQDDEERRELERLAAEAGVQVTEPQGFAPVVGLLIIVGAGAAIAAVYSAYERWRGGQVFDLRANPLNGKAMYRSRDLQYGLIAIYAADGNLEVQANPAKDPFLEVVAAVAKVVGEAATKTVDAVKDALKELGDKVKVTGETSGDAAAINA